MLSSAAPESVPEAAIKLMALVPQRLWPGRSKLLLNRVGRVNNQIVRFENNHYCLTMMNRLHAKKR